jgi:hypothetical protein
MTGVNSTATRRSILIKAAGLAAVPLIAATSEARAAGTVPQANAKYRPAPNGAAQCSKCNYFLPGASATVTGKCKIVAGDISPHGWCQLFAPKPA